MPPRSEKLELPHSRMCLKKYRERAATRFRCMVVTVVAGIVALSLGVTHLMANANRIQDEDVSASARFPHRTPSQNARFPSLAREDSGETPEVLRPIAEDKDVVVEEAMEEVFKADSAFARRLHADPGPSADAEIQFPAETHKQRLEERPPANEGDDGVHGDHQTKLTSVETTEDSAHLALLAEQAERERTQRDRDTEKLHESSKQSGEEAPEARPYGTQMTIFFANRAPLAADLYYDDGRFGVFVETFEPGEALRLKTFVGHRFFWTKKGTRVQLVAGPGQGIPMEPLMTGDIQEVNLPPDTRPREPGCRDRYKICHDEALRGGCGKNPAWMGENCCESCQSMRQAQGAAP